MHRITRLTALALVAVGVLAGPAATALAASSPSVTATNPTHVGQTSAQFNGTVNPNGATTSYSFQYGLTSAYGLATPVKSAGHGTKSVRRMPVRLGPDSRDRLSLPHRRPQRPRAVRSGATTRSRPSAPRPQARAPDRRPTSASIAPR